jgi:hypothetical protein
MPTPREPHSRRAIALALAAAALLALPALGKGFIIDDYVQLATLEGAHPSSATRFNLWNFRTGTREEVRRLAAEGATSWWERAEPEGRMAFFRPVPSALLGVDHALFGRSPAGYHAHSILWYLLLVASAGLLLRRTPGGAAGSLALVLFAVDESHWEVIAHVAARHIAVAAVLGILGLLAHVRWRQEGWRPGRPLSILAFALALLASEAALQAWCLLLAFELAGTPRERARRLRALAPTGLLVALYLALYALGGYGAHEHGYVDLLAHPAAWLSLWPKLLLFLAELLVGLRVPREGWEGARAGWLLGAAALLFFAAVLRAARARSPGPAWLWLGGLLSLLPVLGAKPGGRLLLVPSLGAAAALATAISFGWAIARGRVPAPRAGRAAAAALTAGLLALHLALSPLARVQRIRAADIDLHERRGLALWRSAIADAEVDRSGPGAVVLLTTPKWLNVLGLRCLEPHDPGRKVWWDLSLPFSDVELTRIGPRSVAIRYTPTRSLARVERARSFAVGEKIETRLARIHVLELAHGWPRRVEVEFSHPLDGGSVAFAAWRGGRFVQVEVPPLAAPAGAG